MHHFSFFLIWNFFLEKQKEINKRKGKKYLSKFNLFPILFFFLARPENHHSVNIIVWGDFKSELHRLLKVGMGD